MGKQLSRWSFILAAVSAAAASACGPSTAQVRAAQTAHYRADASVVFGAVNRAVSRHFAIVKNDAEHGEIITRPRWYESDGTFQDKDARAGLIHEDGDIVLAFDVVVSAGADGAYTVQVNPVVDRWRSGYGAPYRMIPDDPQVPGWVKGMVSDLYVDIHGELASYDVAAP